MSICNHVWRDTALPAPKKNKEDLLVSVKNADSKGWWLKGDEFTHALPLIESNEIKYCKSCEGNKAVIITIGEKR